MSITPTVQENTELLNQAVALHQSGQLDKAEGLYQVVLVNEPNQVMALHMLGTLFMQQGHLEKGIALLEKSIALNPVQPSGLTNVANALNLLGKHTEALKLCDQALGYAASYLEAWNIRGNALNGLGRLDEAIESYNKAIAINPDFVEAHYNLGNTYKALKRYPEALVSYTSTIQLMPNLPEAHNNLGITYQDINLCREAIVSYDRAIELRPDYIEPHWNKSLMKLMLGEFSTGWSLYEWGWKGDTPLRGTPKHYPQPLWLGEQSIAGKTLLLHAEQGLGDTIQFCRYALMAVSHGANVILQVQPSLVTLLETLGHGITVIGYGQPLPQFDLHCPLMSLPLAFNTDINTIPAPVPYLAVPATYQTKWTAKLGSATKPRIGLVWAGSSKDQNDHNRSLTLAMIAPLLDLEAEFHCLQKDILATDLLKLIDFPNIKLHTSELNDFADTAALASAMDLVISVDTSVAHLAGALGKPVWILLPYAPDFRWMLHREDSPWYPTAQLFRQSNIDQWPALVDKLKLALQDYLQG